MSPIDYLDGVFALIGAGTLAYYFSQRFVKKSLHENYVPAWTPTKLELLGFLAFFVAQPLFAGIVGGANTKLYLGYNSILYAIVFTQTFSLLFLIVALRYVPAIFPNFSRETLCVDSAKDFIKIALLFCVALGVVAVFSAISNLIPALFPSLAETWQQNQSLVNALRGNADGFAFASVFVAAVFLTPIIEEFIFRFAFYRFFKGSVRNGVVASVVTGTLFAVLHDSPAAWLPLIALNCVLCFSYEKTGRLIAPIIVHALFNANTIILILFEK